MTLGYWPWMAACLLVVAALAIARNRAGAAKTIPIIKVDDEHLQLEQEGTPAPMYTPTTEFILDADGYKLSYPQALAGKEVDSNSDPAWRGRRLSRVPMAARFGVPDPGIPSTFIPDFEAVRGISQKASSLIGWAP